MTVYGSWYVELTGKQTRIPYIPVAAATLVWMIGVESVCGFINNNNYTFLSCHEVNLRVVEQWRNSGVGTVGKVQCRVPQGPGNKN